jgi:hypothetical protein
MINSCGFSSQSMRYVLDLFKTQMRNNIFNGFIILMRITYFLSKKIRKKKNTPIKLVSVLALINFLSILLEKKELISEL